MNTKSKRTFPRLAVLGAALCTSVLSAPMVQAAEGDDWEWMVAPYGWLVGFDTDLERSVPPAGGISSDTNFESVIDKLDGAFQIHIEGQNDTWGFFSDFTFLGLADENEYARFNTDSDLDARLFELAGVWSPDGERYRGLDVFAGLRYIDVDLTVAFDPIAAGPATTTFDSGESFSDLMLGARYTWALSDRWTLTLRGDGSFGGTEGTWNGSGLLGYRTGNGAWLFGYRYLSIELETGDTDTNLVMSGPMVGYGFRF